MIKVITRAWMPRALDQFAPWYANFSLKFAQFAAPLGLASDAPKVDEDNQTVQWLADADEVAKANLSGFRTFRDETLFADKNSTKPTAPVTNLPVEPAKVSWAIIQRLINLVERIELAPAYTSDIGAQLGIIPPIPGSISPADVKPTVQVFGAQSGYHFSVVIGSRAESNLWEVEIRRAGQEKWSVVKTATGKSVDVTIEPTIPGQPEQLQVRIQLQKNNADYGQPSDAVYVTVNP
jgi:hypothetical protein